MGRGIFRRKPPAPLRLEPSPRWIERIVHLFGSMPSETVERVLQTYRMRYGEGAYLYARRTVERWKPGEVTHLGQTTRRLLEIVPLYADGPTKYELVRLVREEMLPRYRSVDLQMEVSADAPLDDVWDRVREAVEAQSAIEIDPEVWGAESWLGSGDARVYQRLAREGEARLLRGLAEDFRTGLIAAQKLRPQVPPSLEVAVLFQIATTRLRVRNVHSKSGERGNMEPEDLAPDDDRSLLAKWNALELESRFRSGEVSYPEYVLRNMDRFFTPDEQAELRKIAALHGLELERQLMEIQIKSRTSEADLQKLVDTLRTLKEKGIQAEVVSRHETPSGHIEIAARSRKWGCLPGSLSLFFLLALAQALSR